jgi:hypothetical protein
MRFAIASSGCAVKCVWRKVIKKYARLFPFPRIFLPRKIGPSGAFFFWVKAAEQRYGWYLISQDPRQDVLSTSAGNSRLWRDRPPIDVSASVCEETRVFLSLTSRCVIVPGVRHPH